MLVTDPKSVGNQTPCGPTPASKLTTEQGLPGNETPWLSWLPDKLQFTHTNHGTLHRKVLREATEGQWGAEERRSLIYKRVVEATLLWEPLFTTTCWKHVFCERDREREGEKERMMWCWQIDLLTERWPTQSGVWGWSQGQTGDPLIQLLLCYSCYDITRWHAEMEDSYWACFFAWTKLNVFHWWGWLHFIHHIPSVETAESLTWSAFLFLPPDRNDVHFLNS